MAWDPRDHQIELLTEPTAGGQRLTGWMRHTTRTGEVYLQPVPNFWTLRDLTFSVIGPPHPSNTAKGGNELSLTGSPRAGVFGGRKA